MSVELIPGLWLGVSRTSILFGWHLILLTRSQSNIWTQGIWGQDNDVHSELWATLMLQHQSQHTCCHVQCWSPLGGDVLPAHQKVGTLLAHLAEKRAFALDHSGSEQGVWPQCIPVLGSSRRVTGRWCVAPVMSVDWWCVSCHPVSGSPRMGGSSYPPVMTKLSNCGTRPAGSVSIRTVSMAGKFLDPLHHL